MLSYAQRVVRANVFVSSTASAAKRRVLKFCQSFLPTRLQLLLSLTLVQSAINALLCADALWVLHGSTGEARSFALATDAYYRAFSFALSVNVFSLKQDAIRHDSPTALVGAAVCSLLVGITPTFEPLSTLSARDALLPERPQQGQFTLAGYAALAASSLISSCRLRWIVVDL